jgi:hypothetical protein
LGEYEEFEDVSSEVRGMNGKNLRMSCRIEGNWEFLSLLRLLMVRTMLMMLSGALLHKTGSIAKQLLRKP